MIRPTFDTSRLSEADYALAISFLERSDDASSNAAAWRLENPDFVIAPDGIPYLYRWYIIPRNAVANVYFHIQVGDDPDRGLHDHYYDNTSVILAGGYYEHVHEYPNLVCCDTAHQAIQQAILRLRNVKHRRPGDVVHRKAEDAHRLSLPLGVPYSMSLFTTGPRRRMWGFHTPEGWRPFEDVTETKDGVSVHKELMK